MKDKTKVVSMAAMLAFSSAAAAAPVPAQVNLTSGSVAVYDYGEIKLHAYNTGDALNDQAYVVESKDGLAGIELPAFTAGLDAWKNYTESLNKPLKGVFVSAHPAGGNYVKGIAVYGTQKAKEAIAGGSTAATTQGLAAAFGADFHGHDIAQIDHIVSVGKVSVGFQKLLRRSFPYLR